MIKRVAAIAAVSVVILAGIAYHLVYGYVVVDQVAGPLHVLQRKNALDAIGANVIIYAGVAESIVIDTQLKPVASSTRAKLEALSNAQITTVVVTHWHPDHSGGIVAYSSDTEVIAHQNVLQRLSHPQEGFGLTHPDSHHNFAPRSPLGLPTRTIIDALSFTVDSTEVRIVHLPQAHTDGDLAVFFPDIKVVAVGDLLWPASFPFVDVHNGGSVAGIESALQTLIETTSPAYRFVPGHGRVQSFADVFEYLEMVRQSRAWVEAKLDAGQSAGQIIAQGLPTKWQHWASALVPASAWIQMIVLSRGNTREAMLQP